MGTSPLKHRIILGPAEGRHRLPRGSARSQEASPGSKHGTPSMRSPSSTVGGSGEDALRGMGNDMNGLYD